jgi:hypothetical protein
MTVIAVMLLYCSPSFVGEWQSNLEHHSWIGQPVDVLAVRKSALPEKVDAVLVVNQEAGRWQQFTSKMIS